MQIVGQIRNVVSGRLDINIILKCSEFTWNGRPGAWLYVVREGASIIRELGGSKRVKLIIWSGSRSPSKMSNGRRKTYILCMFLSLISGL